MATVKSAALFTITLSTLTAGRRSIMAENTSNLPRRISSVRLSYRPQSLALR